MGCKRFEDQLMDAVLGGLLPERETELRAHLRECAACRTEFERQQQLVTAMDHSLEQMAAVNPSPEMVARIRLKIAEQPAPSRRWLLGWWPAAAGAVAVVALFIFLMLPRSVQQPGERTSVVPPATSAPASQTPERPSEVPVVSPNREKREPRTASAPRKETSKFPEVLVTEDEWRQVVRLYELAQRGRANMDKLAPRDATLLEEKAQPLVIARLEPIRPLIEERLGGRPQ